MKQCSRFECNFRFHLVGWAADTMKAVVLVRWVKDHKPVLNEVIFRIVLYLIIKQIVLCFSCSPLSFEETLQKDYISFMRLGMARVSTFSGKTTKQIILE